ncbi:MGMT family protein [Anaerotardibacter muris]|uniref:MGMT family protein n=1 Tax=Anaerotardibacter muris TaxID=2941505 RepID=UPI003B84797E
MVKHIPRGKVSTYGQVARLIGAPRSARYVGYALRANPEPGTDPHSIPCHRVVFKDGRMATGFAFGGEEVQRKLLEDEGVAFDDEGRVVMDEFLWNGIPEQELSDEGLPMGPPPDFDWERELAEYPIEHDPATCGKDCPNCKQRAR